MKNPLEIHTGNPDDEIVDAHEMARMVNCSTKTLTHWFKLGIIPRIQHGRWIRYEKTKVLQALRKGESWRVRNDRKRKTPAAAPKQAAPRKQP